MKYDRTVALSCGDVLTFPAELWHSCAPSLPQAQSAAQPVLTAYLGSTRGYLAKGSRNRDGRGPFCVGTEAVGIKGAEGGSGQRSFCATKLERSCVRCRGVAILCGARYLLVRSQTSAWRLIHAVGRGPTTGHSGARSMVVSLQ